MIEDSLWGIADRALKWLIRKAGGGSWGGFRVKISPEEERTIQRLRRRGLSYPAIARITGRGISTAYKYAHGLPRRWRWWGRRP